MEEKELIIKLQQALLKENNEKLKLSNQMLECIVNKEIPKIHKNYGQLVFISSMITTGIGLFIGYRRGRKETTINFDVELEKVMKELGYSDEQIEEIIRKAKEK